MDKTSNLKNELKHAILPFTTGDVPKQQAGGDKVILHPWDMAEVYMFTHLSTGLRFFCEPKKPTPHDPDHWITFIIDNMADEAVINAQADDDGQTPDNYVFFLARAAMDLADKLLSKKRRGVSVKSARMAERHRKRTAQHQSR